MPWTTPTLDELRALNRDNITGKLRSGPMIPNSVLRVMADANAGLAYLTLLYLDWLAEQLMPDTAEKEWLDRFGDIWLTNADGSRGRKTATFATGVANITGINGTPLASGSELSATTATGTVTLQTTNDIVVGSTATPVNFVALTPGALGLIIGSSLTLTVAVAGVSDVILATIIDGIDEETDDDLRVRVLDRIREPPMGGDAFDYVEWALDVPGVTRAWCAPNEMGIGTVTLRFMMDNVRADGGGFPLPDDVTTVSDYLDTVRPVTVKDFVVAPIPEPIDFTISNLSQDNAAVRAAIAAAVTEMLHDQASPSYSLNGVLQGAQTIYAVWVSEAIMSAEGVDHFDLTMVDHPMPNNGCMAVLGTITYA
jgi:uncharacterized phage protein gp47/JayE